jgi:sulfotransferase
MFEDKKNLNKQYFFLSGLFRSGNTVLASILNQNNNIYVSPLSPVVEYMWQCHNSNIETALTYPNKNNIKNVISKIIENFYQDTNKSVIVDRNKTWINPDNIYMIKQYLNNNPKIIFTIRPLIERIVSIINIMKNDLLLDMKKNNFLYNKNKSENDNIVEYLLTTNFYQIDYFSYNSFIEKNNKGLIHLVKYENLINNPTETLNKIYDFLNLNIFSHNFNNIKKIEEELDVENSLTSNLHKVNNTLKNNGLDPSDFLSKKTIQKINKLDLFYN